MFLLHHSTQKDGSFDVGFCAYRPIWKLPVGRSVPKSTLDFSGVIVRSKPCAFHWFCTIWAVSRRRWLPVVVFSSNVAFFPALAQMPSAPLAQPSDVISCVTLSAAGGEYTLNGVL